MLITLRTGLLNFKIHQNSIQLIGATNNAPADASQVPAHVSLLQAVSHTPSGKKPGAHDEHVHPSKPASHWHVPKSLQAPWPEHDVDASQNVVQTPAG